MIVICALSHNIGQLIVGARNSSGWIHTVGRVAQMRQCVVMRRRRARAAPSA